MLQKLVSLNDNCSKLKRSYLVFYHRERMESREQICRSCTDALPDPYIPKSPTYARPYCLDCAKKSSRTFSLPERAPTNVMLTQILHVCCLPQKPIDLITDLQTTHQLRISIASAAHASQIICEIQSID